MKISLRIATKSDMPVVYEFMNVRKVISFILNNSVLINDFSFKGFSKRIENRWAENVY